MPEVGSAAARSRAYQVSTDTFANAKLAFIVELYSSLVRTSYLRPVHTKFEAHLWQTLQLSALTACFKSTSQADDASLGPND